MSRHRHIAVVLAASVAAALVSVVLPVAAAQAARPEYVALGDSFASGLGTREYYPRSGACKRSPHAYAVDQAVRLRARLSFRACAGAVVAGVRSDQLGTLDTTTDYVSVQVGGNDAGFTSVVAECAKPAWAQDCAGAVADARAVIKGKLPGRLARLYRDIASRAPSAVVLVVGYPRLFHGEDCNAGTFFSPADRRLLNDAADLLNVRLARRAGAADFAFSDPTSAFLGHAVCDRREWINGLSHPVVESYHPNRAGQDGYGDLVAASLT